MKNFRCYDLSKSLYQECKQLPLPRYLKDQLERASLLVCLNLAEGSGKSSAKDRRRFYEIAMGSLRETQAILEVTGNDEVGQTADKLGGGLFKLIRVL